MLEATSLYLRYLLRHKLYVAQAGLRYRVPLWRLLLHDWSKFTRAEWSAYRDYFYGPSEGRQKGSAREHAFNRAWWHHQHVNDHHWQYWLLTLDSGEVLPQEMPEVAAREMVADWAGAGRAITGRWEVQGWYQRHYHTIGLHPTTRALVDHLLNVDGTSVPPPQDDDADAINITKMTGTIALTAVVDQEDGSSDIGLYVGGTMAVVNPENALALSSRMQSLAEIVAQGNSLARQLIAQNAPQPVLRSMMESFYRDQYPDGDMREADLQA